MFLNHPKLWGPLMWYLLHTISLDDSNNLEDNIYKEFYNKISQIFPCDKCKFHYNKHLDKYPVPYKSELHSYLVYIHNQVRKFQNKEYIDNISARDLYLVSREDNEEKVLPINHNYLASLFKILHESPISNKIILLIPLISKLFPCQKCRQLLLKNEKMNTLDLIDIIKSHQLTEDENKLLKKQTFTFEVNSEKEKINRSGNKSRDKLRSNLKNKKKARKRKLRNKNMWKPVKTKYL